MISQGKFPHRHNLDGTYDSICPECLATIGTAQKEEDLNQAESRHACDPVNTYRVSQGHRQRQTYVVTRATISS